MKTFSYTITEENGIHARPAGLLVNMAKKSDEKITIYKADKPADAKRLLAVMGLGAKKDDILRVEVEGSNEETVAKDLEAFFQENL